MFVLCLSHSLYGSDLGDAFLSDERLLVPD